MADNDNTSGSGIMNMLNHLNPFRSDPTPAPAVIPGTNTPVPVEPTGMDKFSDIGKLPDPDPKAPPAFDPQALLTIDPEQFKTAVGKLDFVGAISDDHAAAIAAGGPDAIKAVQALLQNTSRQVFTQAVIASREMSTTAISKSMPEVDRRFEENMRRRDATTAIREADPIFNHPAASPIFQAVKDSMMAKFPNADPTELQEKAKEYIKTFVDAVKPGEIPKPVRQGTETNWDDWGSTNFN